MIKECVSRMEIFGLQSEVIDEFEKDKRIYVSMPSGRLKPADDFEMEIVDEIENVFGVKVYHMVASLMGVGAVYALLYVSAYPGEWEEQEWEIENLEPVAYVYNCSAPILSEFGSVGLRRTGVGSLTRVW